MSTLTVAQQDESNKRGERAVAPGELTRGIEYQERGGMWQREMASRCECVGSWYGVASERR